MYSESSNGSNQLTILVGISRWNLFSTCSSFISVMHIAGVLVLVLNVVATIFKDYKKCPSHFCCKKFVFGITTKLPYYEFIGHSTFIACYCFLLQPPYQSKTKSTGLSLNSAGQEQLGVDGRCLRPAVDMIMMATTTTVLWSDFKEPWQNFCDKGFNCQSEDNSRPSNDSDSDSF